MDDMSGSEFFGPSTAAELEASLEDNGVQDMASFFATAGADGDPLAALLNDTKSAAEVAGADRPAQLHR